MTQTIWTEESLREQLPHIKVKLLATGEVLDGRILGRKLDFAHVQAYLPAYRMYHDEQYCWATLVDVLNGDGILCWGTA